ncbi:MAG: TadE family protein [Fuerstiella sp.]
MMFSPVRKSSDKSRKGAATVEAAVCLPLLIVLVFGSVESSNGIFLKQSLTIAAYEAAKIAAAPRGTKQNATVRCSEVLAVRDVDNFEISFSPNNLDANTPRGQTIEVTVTVDADAAALGPLWIFEGKSLQKTVVMRRL